MSNLFVVAMGLGTVFVGLICIIFISKIMSFLCIKFEKKSKREAPVTTKINSAAQTEIVNKQEFVAAVSAVIAEQLGCGVEGIRIKSIKRI